MDEEGIWARIQQSDSHALKILFDQQYRPLCVYALQFAQCLPDAEDIVQGVFIKLWTKREELDIKTSIKAYLYKSVFNACMQNVRRDKKTEGTLDFIKHKVLQEQTQEDDSELLEKIEKIKILVDSLPDRCKEILLLSKKEGYKNKEIADKLGISIKTVESQMRIAFKKIRKGFGKNNDEIVLMICVYNL
ncbi:RNA polymerase sigma-70 factor [Kriegella aquimaris]|uniref:RNA polymerase sigma-70 factor, ECF subfamily n=1 Tax=Kriegella aquimaris TaxID=192904 RepID=A0A1G9T2J1_9FLAO|nr:RNA polymerase sigma-70 factor [Kriegella aquimaris]SDM41870.1 RNA polymerase sigma-70 factor, ECF subfamily [Kriegella aquimaris]